MTCHLTQMPVTVQMLSSCHYGSAGLRVPHSLGSMSVTKPECSLGPHKLQRISLVSWEVWTVCHKQRHHLLLWSSTTAWIELQRGL